MNLKLNTMMNKIIVIVIFELLFSMIQNTYAINKEIEEPRFSGIIKSHDKMECAGDTLSIAYRKPYTPDGTNQEVIRVIADDKGHFSFKLPIYNIPVGMTMSIRHKGKYSRIYAVDRYFFEMYDKVKIEILLNNEGTFEAIYFSGPGSEKYNVSTQCSKIFDSGYHGEFFEGYWNLNLKSNFDNDENIEDKFLTYTQFTKKMIRKQDSIIENSHLTTTMKKMMAYQHSKIFREWIFRLNFYYDIYEKKTNKRAMGVIKDIYEKYKEEFINPYPQDSLMALCTNFLFDQANRESWALLAMDNKFKNVGVNDLYDVLKSKYTGILREMLIANLFIAGHGIRMNIQPKVMDSLSLDAEKYIITQTVKNIYTSKLKLVSGIDVFNAVFKDINDHNISIASLRGKVIFLDIWGWGCSACAKFHQMFHKDVYPMFNDRKDFVYLSISADKTKSLYTKSLSSGKYTSIDYLNVYMKDLGLLNHPFSKYYEIGSTPFLLLIDRNGKICTSVISGDPKQVIDVITDALEIPRTQSK